MTNNTVTPGELVPVSDFMTTSVVTANENQSVRYVCKLMCNRKIGSVVILENTKGSEAGSNKKNGVVVGIVTERDYVHLIGFSDMFLVDIPISEIMSKPLITIRKFASITDAVSVMQAKNIRRLPVVDSAGKNDWDNNRQRYSKGNYYKSFIGDESVNRPDVTCRSALLIW